MTDRDALPRFPAPAYTCVQDSSYDRASTSPQAGESWFANDDSGHYIRVEHTKGREEAVLIDAAGPGAIVRIWSANPQGTLRVYLDGSDEPVIEGRAAEILSGESDTVPIGVPLGAEKSRGFNCYLPIPYARSCKVTCEGAGSMYYQVNSRRYPAGTVVQTLTAAALLSAKPQLAATNQTLLRAPARHATWTKPWRVSVVPDQRADFPAPAGPGCVSRVAISLSKDSALGAMSEAERERALRRAILVMECDAEPTIWCPLSDFFGAGVGVSALRDWYRTVSPGDQMEVRWVMPYARGATLSVLNLGETPLTLDLELAGGPWDWDDRSMHFRAGWRQEKTDSRPIRDWNYATITGRGVYVGDGLSVVNPVEEWWGEGDEKIYVDGEKFPSHFGTGTEDYYGYAWCSPEVFTSPFHAQTRCDGPGNRGITCVSRVRSLDAIPFTTSLRFDMEIWHWKKCDELYAAATFFYAQPGATSNRGDESAEARRSLAALRPAPPAAFAGAIECERMAVLGKSKGLSSGRQSLAAFKAGTWSAGEHLWVKAEHDGEFVELSIPAAGDAPVHVTLHATRSWDYGIVRFFLNGELAGPDTDLCDGVKTATPSGPIDLGLAMPRDGAITLRVEVVGPGRGAAGTGRYFGLDCVMLDAE